MFDLVSHEPIRHVTAEPAASMVDLATFGSETIKALIELKALVFP